MTNLRDLPSVDKLLRTEKIINLVEEFGHSLTVETIRITLDSARARFSERLSIPGHEEITAEVKQQLLKQTNPSLRSVLNASGVILHTNLGRAPLSQEAIKAMQVVAQGYSTLEYDLDTGQRGSRSYHAETILTRLTGAEGAFVVNNNASALLLILTAFARRKRVVIARSQLVEIGGGFRIPEVMKQSGSKLLEIGTTNRVHLSDYERALSKKSVKLVVRVHRSNFAIIGFTSEPNLKEIVDVAHIAGVNVIDDLGSGALLETEQYGLGHEPTVQESLNAGADLVCFSGDKLLGGPQAGIIVGRRRLIEKLITQPLARAIRADKLCLSSLSATLLHYLKDEAVDNVPVWRMISAKPEKIHKRAQNWVEELGFGNIIPSESAVGGGSLPGETLPTFNLALMIPSPVNFLARLRSGHPPIIARVQDDLVVFDPRSILPEQDDTFIYRLKNAIREVE